MNRPAQVQLSMTQDEILMLRRHLRAQYAGVFKEGEIEPFIAEYIDVHHSHLLAQQLLASGGAGKRMLDIGSGYGSNVLAAREVGIDAVGIEIEPFEVDFARERLRRQRPADSPERVYVLGDGARLAFPDESFDIVTLMNVVEHVPDYRQLLQESVRVLRPGGLLLFVCPNYAAFRREAHYHVPWLPLLPKALASRYLSWLGRDPAFLRSSIHYCTNWGILRCLRRLPLRVRNPDLDRLDRLDLIRHERIRRTLQALQRFGLLGLVRLLLAASFYNPLRHSISIRAIKHDQ